MVARCVNWLVCDMMDKVLRGDIDHIHASSYRVLDFDRSANIQARLSSLTGNQPSCVVLYSQSVLFEPQSTSRIRRIVEVFRTRKGDYLRIPIGLIHFLPASFVCGT